MNCLVVLLLVVVATDRLTVFSLGPDNLYYLLWAPACGRPWYLITGKVRSSFALNDDAVDVVHDGN